MEKPNSPTDSIHSSGSFNGSKKYNTLITGTKSGLGRFLQERFGSCGVRRDMVIVHCAHKYVASDNDGNHFRNYKLLLSVSSLPHKKIIYISSVDALREDSNGISKKTCEDHVRTLDNWTIIRIPMLFGKYQRKNCVRRIQTESNPSITLHEDSKFGFCFNIEVEFLIKKIIDQDYQGVIEYVLNDWFTLKQLSEKLNRTVNFGSFVYK